jgi:hypothetical protein
MYTEPKYAVFQDAEDKLRIYATPHLEKGNLVGQWAIINKDVSEEEAFSTSVYARPRVICWVAGAGSRQQAQMLCDAMNNHPDYQTESVEDIRWMTE